MYVGGIFGAIVAIYLLFRYEQAPSRQQQKREHQERIENRKLIDATRCASCTNKIGADIDICPNCGFNMGKIRDLKSQ